MDTRGYLETELTDVDVVYATGHDVFTHIRNKRFDDLPATPQDTEVGDGGILTKKQVVDLIERFSERADNTTKRAWRRRKVVDYTVPVKFSHTQKRGRHRRRARRSSYGGTPRVNNRAGRRGMANLPHNHIDEVEKVEVLNPRSIDDITADEGRESGSYVVDERKGIIRPNTTLFVPTGRTGGGHDIENAQIRVTYVYGHDPAPETVDDLEGDRKVSTAVPGDVRDAVALLTAARLVGSDQYGELVPNQSGDEPSLAEAVSSWKGEAKSVLREFTRP